MSSDKCKENLFDFGKPVHLIAYEMFLVAVVPQQTELVILTSRHQYRLWDVDVNLETYKYSFHF